MTDETLAARPDAEAALGIVDTTPDVTSEDFDFDKFLAGVRATRRSVQVYARADLIGDMEQVQGDLQRLAGDYESLVEKGAPAAQRKAVEREFDATNARFGEIKDAYEASARWFTLEKRSGEWVRALRKESAKRHGITLPEEDDEDATMSQEDYRAILLDQLAGQIVNPAGVTAEGLVKLYEANEGELGKLVAAMTFANDQVSSAAQVLTRDFSLPRSPKTPPAGSKRR